MAKRKERLTEGKKNIIASLIEEYDIKTAENIQDALKDLLGGTIESMLKAELDNHLGYDPYEITENSNSRNGSKYGEIEVNVPQDRENSFEPKIVKKRQKDISQIEDIYGFEVSDGLVSDITDKLIPEIEDWQHRPLNEVYPVVYIDAIHFSIRDNHVIKKLAAYIILGINQDGIKEVLSIQIGENESSKYWLSVLNELKNRGVKDILILCADGLAGIKYSIGVAFPNTEYQCCIVHQVRNTLKHVSYKDKKLYAKGLKSIYNAESEERAHEIMLDVKEKWEKQYPNSMKSWLIIGMLFAQYLSFHLMSEK